MLYTELQERNLVPERGIEPPSTDYETVVLPLYYAGILQRPTEESAPQPKRNTFRSASSTRSYFGGDDGSRTHGLFVANEALFQLSYIPEIRKRVAYLSWSANEA